MNTTSIPDRGIDLQREQRPGVPMERSPAPVGSAHWDQPPAQAPARRITKRMELEALTPVYGTAQPPRGISGLLRRMAYRVPEHRPRHWVLLLVADRVDVLEHGPGMVLPILGMAALATVGIRSLLRRS